MTRRFADYELVERFGEGNHGTYWKAVPPKRLGIADSLVALKVLTSHGTPDDFRRASNELRLLHSLRHPNLVELLDAGNASGALFIATRWYGQGTLEDASGRVDQSLVVQVVADAAEAAHAMHDVGVAHRDIKPRNIVFDGERGRLADLGLAQMVGTERTIGGGPIGSLGFIDPLVVRGEDASRQSDIFSLAATLHIALTGAGVFGEIPQTGVFEACRYVLRTPVSVATGLPDGLREIMERALRARSVERSTWYLTAQSFATDLRDVLRASSAAG